MKKILKKIFMIGPAASIAAISPVLLTSCGDNTVWYNMKEQYSSIAQYEPSVAEKEGVSNDYTTSLYKTKAGENKKIFESDFITAVNNKIKDDTTYLEASIHCGTPAISKLSDVLSFSYYYKFKQNKPTSNGTDSYDIQINASFASIPINTFSYADNKWIFSIVNNYRDWPETASLSIVAKGEAKINGEKYYNLSESFKITKWTVDLTENQAFVVNEMYDRGMIITFTSDYLTQLAHK